MADDSGSGKSASPLAMAAAVVALVASSVGIYSQLHSVRDSEAAKAATQDAAGKAYAVQVYDKVQVAIASGNHQQQKAALALVMTLPDSPSRDEMVAALESAQGANAALTPQPPEARVPDSVLRPLPQGLVAAPATGRSASLAGGSLGDYRVDIFWCESGGEAARSVAEAAAARLGSSVAVPPRVRMLSDANNADPRYMIADNIVRYDPGEQKLAQDVALMIGLASGVHFAARPALPGKPSVNYLSAFVCNVKH